MTRASNRSHIKEHFVYQCPYCDAYQNSNGRDFVTREQVTSHIDTKAIAEEYDGVHRRGRPEEIVGLTKEEYYQLTDPTYELKQRIQELEQENKQLREKNSSLGQRVLILVHVVEDMEDMIQETYGRMREL